MKLVGPLALAASLTLSAGLGAAVVGGSGASASEGAVAGLSPLVVQGASDLGPAPGARPVDLTLVLPLADPAGLSSLIAQLYDPASPGYHRWLTPAQFVARFSPRPAATGAVAGWAQGAGLSVTSVSANRTLVQVSGTAAAVGRAFAARLDTWSVPGGSAYLSPVTTARLPDALHGLVSAVVGLSGVERVTLADASPPVLGVGHSLGPKDLASVYQAPAGIQGRGQTIAVLAEGDLAPVKADLAAFERTFGLPKVAVTSVATGPPTSDTSDVTEFDLDTQYATGLAPGVARLLLYDATSLSDADVLAEINRFVTDDRAQEASFSAGECETLAKASGFLDAADAALAQGVAQGQTLFAASGDEGAYCPALVSVAGIPLGLPGVSYPASSPYAVGVGGTSLAGGSGPLAEVAWTGSGGGVSLFEPRPACQSSVPGLALGRSVPDVAFDADPATGFRVMVGGSQVTLGGTSAAAPAWLGVWARTQQAHGGRLGFAAPVVYREPAGAFHDVTVGFNGLALATPGYDELTGRGSPDIAAFIAGA